MASLSAGKALLTFSLMGFMYVSALTNGVGGMTLRDFEIALRRQVLLRWSFSYARCC